MAPFFWQSGRLQKESQQGLSRAQRCGVSSGKKMNREKGGANKRAGKGIYLCPRFMYFNLVHLSRQKEGKDVCRASVLRCEAQAERSISHYARFFRRPSSHSISRVRRVVKSGRSVSGVDTDKVGLAAGHGPLEVLGIFFLRHYLCQMV